MKNAIIKSIVIFICIVTNFISYANNSGKIDCSFDLSSKAYDMHNSFQKLTSDNIADMFPYQNYLDSASWWSFNTIKSTFSNLEVERNIDRNSVNKVLRDCLVDTLLSKWNFTNVDSLELLLTILEKYQSYAEASPELASFFGEISDYYGIYVANKLTELANKDKSLKSTFPFIYVAQHSRCLKYAPNVSLDNTEKVFKNLAEGNLSYLWNRFWKGTSFFFKVLVILPGLILLTIYIYGAYLIFKKHLKSKTL